MAEIQSFWYFQTAPRRIAELGVLVCILWRNPESECRV